MSDTDDLTVTPQEVAEFFVRISTLAAQAEFNESMRRIAEVANNVARAYMQLLWVWGPLQRPSHNGIPTSVPRHLFRAVDELPRVLGYAWQQDGKAWRLIPA